MADERVDPNVRVPAQVTAAAERANEIAAQIQGANLRTPPPPPPRVVTKNSDTSASPPAPLPANGEDWEHKFNSMKGRYDVTEQRARQQAQQIAELQRLLALNASQIPPAPRPVANSGQVPNAASGDVRFGGGQPVAPPKFISDTEQQEYGKELLDVMGRRTMEIVAPEFQKLGSIVNQLMSENAQLKAQVGGVTNVVQHDASGRFYDILDHELPDWEVTNHDPNFVQWLNQVDPYSGRIRKSFLDEAHQNNEASRVLNIIKGYRREQGIDQQAAVNPARDLQPNAGNGAGNTARQPSPQFELQNLAAPGRAKSGQPPTSPDKPFFTSSEINRFYTDVTTGKYEGRDADKNATEQALFLAAKEGRIIRQR